MKLRDIPISTKAEFCCMVSNWKHGMKYKGKDISETDQRALIQEGVKRGWGLPEDKVQTSQDQPDNICNEYDIARLYVFKVDTSARRGIAFELSLNELKKLFNKKTCHYTGKRMVVGDDRLKPTLDRVDSKIGYTKENTVVCCSYVNQLKNELFERPNGDLRIEMKDLLKMLSKLT